MPNFDTLVDQGGIFNIIVPKPFSLERQSSEHLKSLRDEVMDKERTWERVMSSRFFGEYQEFANSWAMRPKARGSKKPRGLFNSRSGETNRSTNTLASLWFSMLTANDPYFEVVRMGLREDFSEIPEEELYGTEQTLLKQLVYSKFKKKLLKSLRSVALFGTIIIEEPFISLPLGDARKKFEYTDFVFRSLLQTGFDPYVFDLDYSDYVFTIDYLTKYQLRDLANSNEDVWNRKYIEESIFDAKNMSDPNHTFESEVFHRIQERKDRAGYSQAEFELFENINYHGKVDTSNKVIQNYWESAGFDSDIRFNDFSVGLVNGQQVVRLHRTPFGTWKHLFKTATYNEFELEPIGYGVGRLGKKIQREIDSTQSRSQDALMLGVYMMMKVGRYAGVKKEHLDISPFGMIKMDDIEQLSQLKIDLNTIVQSLAVQGLLKEDFRAITNATANLQAVATKATATEATLTQSEAMRGASVVAQILAETFLREHIETMHTNNLHFLDKPIQVQMGGQGSDEVGEFDKNNLPINVGMIVKAVTDKDYRPERLTAILRQIELTTNIRQMINPELAMNTVQALYKESFRALGLDPRILTRKIPLEQQLVAAIQQSGRQGGGGALANELAGEEAGATAGGTDIEQSIPGAVPNSPLESLTGL